MPPYSTSADTRSGWDAANTTLIGTLSMNPASAARCDPAASITARMSSLRSSSVGAPATRSDMPVPRLSNTSTRACSAIPRSKAAQPAASHCSSTWETKLGAMTTSNGPSPSTW
jgi:hypothetical protein